MCTAQFWDTFALLRWHRGLFLVMVIIMSQLCMESNQVALFCNHVNCFQHQNIASCAALLNVSVALHTSCFQIPFAHVVVRDFN
jgi:hypothetical protein